MGSTSPSQIPYKATCLTPYRAWVSFPPIQAGQRQRDLDLIWKASQAGQCHPLRAAGQWEEVDLRLVADLVPIQQLTDPIKIGL